MAAVVAVVGRSGWGALPPNWDPGTIQRVDDFVVHHSVTAQPRTIDESIQQVQAIQRDHLTETDGDGKLVYADIAYNVVAGWNCAIVGRGPTKLDGATDTDPTTHTWSVCVLGDYTKDLVPVEIRAGLIEALVLGFQLYGTHPIRPHYDFYATACPGEHVVSELAVVDAAVRQIVGDNGSGSEMTDAEIDKLSSAIVDKLLTASITVHEYDKPGVPAYPTNVRGWLDFVHGELQQTRLKL